MTHVAPAELRHLVYGAFTRLRVRLAGVLHLNAAKETVSQLGPAARPEVYLKEGPDSPLSIGDTHVRQPGPLGEDQQMSARQAVGLATGDPSAIMQAALHPVATVDQAAQAVGSALAEVFGVERELTPEQLKKNAANAAARIAVTSLPEGTTINTVVVRGVPFPHVNLPPDAVQDLTPAKLDAIRNAVAGMDVHDRGHKAGGGRALLDD